eukprot:12256975-Alexandrium_andersonii.AAC.1
MSASLVGSEMCIRDRRFSAGLKAAVSASTCFERSRAPPLRGGLPPRGPCLLYTSDAADDM